AADAGDGRQVALRKAEIGSHPAGAADEQSQGRRLGEDGRDVRARCDRDAVNRRQSKAADVDDALETGTEQPARCGHYADTRGGLEDLVEHGKAAVELLEVVEHQQQPTLGQELEQLPPRLTGPYER